MRRLFGRMSHIFLREAGLRILRRLDSSGDDFTKCFVSLAVDSRLCAFTGRGASWETALRRWIFEGLSCQSPQPLSLVHTLHVYG